MALSYQNVLFATDLSDLSLAAWPHAVGIATAHGATIHAVVVLEEPYALAPYEQYAVLLQALREVKPQVEERLRHAVKDHPANVLVKTAVLEGAAPTQALLDYARRESIDLIVMATHGRSGLTHLLLGSVTEKLLRTSPVPVLAVRPRVS